MCSNTAEILILGLQEQNQKTGDDSEQNIQNFSTVLTWVDKLAKKCLKS